MKQTNYMHDHQQGLNFKVEEEALLLDWLLKHVTTESKSKIKATLKGRGIRVNNKVVTRYDYQLVPGVTVSVSTSKQPETLHNRYVRIVYEDRYLVVIEKNIGILSMAAGHSSLNVKAVLDEYFKQCHNKCTAHVVHRLDRDTSGLMIYAKDKQTELMLESDWHNIVFDRRYVAVLSGRVETPSGTITSWLKDNRAYVTYSSNTDNGGKFAITHYRLLQANDRYSLVEFKLETGRKNQIRVHSADMGHPVCGDIKYGNGDDPTGRLCLHAYVLAFYHPVTHEPMRFQTPIPSSFRQLVK